MELEKSDTRCCRKGELFYKKRQYLVDMKQSVWYTVQAAKKCCVLFEVLKDVSF